MLRAFCLVLTLGSLLPATVAHAGNGNGNGNGNGHAKGKGKHIGKPNMVGDGCPEGTVSTVFTDDGKSMSVLFSSYQVETEPNQKSATRSCRVQIPIDIGP